RVVFLFRAHPIKPPATNCEGTASRKLLNNEKYLPRFNFSANQISSISHQRSDPFRRPALFVFAIMCRPCALCIRQLLTILIGRGVFVTSQRGVFRGANQAAGPLADRLSDGLPVSINAWRSGRFPLGRP